MYWLTSPHSLSSIFMKLRTINFSYRLMIFTALGTMVGECDTTSETPEELKALQKMRTQALTSVVGPYRKLNDKYIELLTKLKADPSLTGNEESLDAIDQEIAILENGENIFLSSTSEPKIEKLREHYMNQVRKMSPAMEASVRKIEEGYATNLYQLMNKLGAAEKIIAASETQKLRDQFLKVWNARRDDPEYLIVSVPPLPQKNGAEQAVPVIKTKDFPIGNDQVIPCCWIKPGKFTIGAEESELGARPGDRTANVTISRGFWMARTETTQMQWQALIADNPSDNQGAKYPVETVDWKYVSYFITKANAAAPAGFRYDLPTEAEWEYACRAGETTAFHNGKDPSSEQEECRHLDKVGWYNGNSNGVTHVVGQKLPNAWGLYDMHGNVWEWCSDYFSYPPKYEEIDPKGPDSGSDRVIRSGSFRHPVREARAAHRLNFNPLIGYKTIGFRMIVRQVEDDDEESSSKSVATLDGETDCFYIPLPQKAEEADEEGGN
jgi:formylglycine-generating enzyme required for sulfatase activity